MPSGDFYDRCKVCDTEAETVHRSEGSGSAGETHHEWDIFSCDPRTGGCGNAWSTTNRQGLAKRDAQGESTSGLTESAITQRAMSLPSDRYRDRYALIDWSL